MKCPDCHAEMLTYAQHLKDGCAVASERHLLDRDLPNRVLSGAERTKKRIRPHTFRARRPDDVGVRCATQGCDNWRVQGASYCRPCHARQTRESKARKRNGEPSPRPPIKTMCARCGEAERIIPDTYCKPCRRAINAEGRSKRKSAPVDYGAVTWRSQKIGK